jgi:aminoglycoside phosphotransferase family enzyme
MQAPATTDHDPGPELEAKIAALLRPETHPDVDGRIDAIETHMSWVVRTPVYVYKLKKPVRSATLDFSTLRARALRCADEVRLNRRLAGDTYLGVVPLVMDEAGALRLGGPGSVVDWLVKMRRLPEARTLERLLRQGAVDAAVLRAVGEKLAHFYARERPIVRSPARTYRALLADVHRTWQALASERYGLSAAALARASAPQLAAARRLRGMLEVRVRDGKLVEGHGDLRPEHVFLVEPEPVIIDCLEFNRALRTLDPADDLGFLALECERMGERAARAIFFDTYRGITGDRPADALVHFYQSYRAGLRAKLAAGHLDEPRYRDCDKWRTRAQDYVELARAHGELAA